MIFEVGHKRLQKMQKYKNDCCHIVFVFIVARCSLFCTVYLAYCLHGMNKRLNLNGAGV